MGPTTASVGKKRAPEEPLTSQCRFNRMRPIHPGEVLREDFLVPLEMSVNALALALTSPPSLHEFVREAEHHYLEETLYRCNGKAGDAAKALGISRKTLWEKCKRYGIRHQSPSSDNSTS